jgi:hypothetical protein
VVDDLHVAIVPILLGAGERLLDALGGAPEGYGCVEFVATPAVAHVRFTPKQR